MHKTYVIPTHHNAERVVGVVGGNTPPARGSMVGKFFRLLYVETQDILNGFWVEDAQNEVILGDMRTAINKLKKQDIIIHDKSIDIRIHQCQMEKSIELKQARLIEGSNCDSVDT